MDENKELREVAEKKPRIRVTLRPTREISTEDIRLTLPSGRKASIAEIIEAFQEGLAERDAEITELKAKNKQAIEVWSFEVRELRLQLAEAKKEI